MQQTPEELRALLTNRPGLVKLVDETGMTRLASACYHGRYDLVEVILEFDEDPMKHLADGRTAFHWAASSPYESAGKCIQLLLSLRDQGHPFSPSMRTRNERGETALHQAIRSHAQKAGIALLESLDDVGRADMLSARDSKFRKPLALAAGFGDVLLVDAILRFDTEVLVWAGDLDHHTGLCTAIHWASACKEPAAKHCIRLLVAYNPRLRAKLLESKTSRSMETPLHIAIRFKNAPAVRALLRSATSADIQSMLRRQSRSSQTPLELAAYQGDRDLQMECLLSEFQNGPPSLAYLIMDGINRGDWLLKFILSMDHPFGFEGGEDSICSWTGETALTAAATGGDVDLILDILKLGADPSVPNRVGWSPLLICCNKGHLEAVRLLVESGVDPNQPSFLQGGKELVPLAVAVIASKIHVVEYLVSLPTVTEATTTNLLGTALHHAARRDANGDIVGILLEKGWNVEAVVESSGNTVLHMLASNKNPWHAAEYLLQKALCGKTLDKALSFLSLENKRGLTASRIAQGNGNLKLAETILAIGDLAEVSRRLRKYLQAPPPSSRQAPPTSLKRPFLHPPQQQGAEKWVCSGMSAVGLPGLWCGIRDAGGHWTVKDLVLGPGQEYLKTAAPQEVKLLSALDKVETLLASSPTPSSVPSLALDLDPGRALGRAMSILSQYCQDTNLYVVQRRGRQTMVRSSLCLGRGPPSYFEEQRLDGIDYPSICLGCSRAIKKPTVLVRAKRRMRFARERDGIMAFQAEERQRQLKEKKKKKIGPT